MAAPPHCAPGAARRGATTPPARHRAERRGRGVGVIVEALESDGPLSRHQLRERLDGEGVPTAGQRLIHLLAAASLAGHVVRGPMTGGHHAFVSVERWLGPPPTGTSRIDDLDRLARRFLVGHAPARTEDLAAWAGITLGDARLAFAAVAGEVRETDGGAVLGSRRSGAPASGRPRLLGPFDPVLHGWASREPFVGTHRSVVTANGIFRAVVSGRRTGGRHLDTRRGPRRRTAGGDRRRRPAGAGRRRR